MILRVDARSATAPQRLQKTRPMLFTRPRMVAELVVAVTDPGSFWYSGAAASLLLDGGTCSVIELQQDQLMYQQMVIDEAGAARTPVPQNAQEYIGNTVDLRIGNEPETLAVDQKLCAELADVEANPLGELSLPESNDAREKRVEQLAFMLMMHTKNRAIQMITRLSDSLNGLEIWERFLEEPVNRGRYRAMLMQLLECPLTGSRGQALEEWERPVRHYEAQTLDTIKAAALAHNPQDSEWCRYVRLSATRLQRHDVLKSVQRERQAQRKREKQAQRQRERKKQR